MRGLECLKKVNATAVARSARVRAQAQANAEEWLRRARVALSAGNHHLYNDLHERAAQELR